MSDTDYFRYLRDGKVERQGYRSLKNVEAGIRYAKSVDKMYKGKWLDEDGKDKYGPDHTYEIEKLVAVYAYPAYLAWRNYKELMDDAY